ncbi:hypothetical protein CUMW_253190 [Citrus unshiu]|uniref:Uncharacterized protein n=1 Tax=Citrus unshiu TaxID=55188 RepID=A0A2H5QQU5_CITUN|nr:hypothetical protein CUMW_253190 [Citrus unshiu]
MSKLILSKVVNGSGVPAVGCLGFAESSQLSYRGVTEERSICMFGCTLLLLYDGGILLLSSMHLVASHGGEMELVNQLL